MGSFDFTQFQLQTQKRFEMSTPDNEGVTQLLMELDAIFSEAEILIQHHEEGDRSLLACCSGCQDCCVRPLFCRSISSTDVKLCRAAVTGQVFGESQTVMMHQFQLQLYKTLFLGVGDGLEQAGLDGRSFQLCGLVRYLLSHPNKEVELLTESSLDWNQLYF